MQTSLSVKGVTGDFIFGILKRAGCNTCFFVDNLRGSQSRAWWGDLSHVGHVGNFCTAAARLYNERHLA